MPSDIAAALLLLQDAGQPQQSDTAVKVVCGVLALILIGIVILRRKARKKREEEEF